MAKSRYSTLRKIIDGKDFTSRHETFPNVTAADLINDNDVFVEWDETKRLDAIAYEYLGSGEYWWIICLLNDIKFPFGELDGGDLLRVPTDLNYVFNVLNSKRNG